MLVIPEFMISEMLCSGSTEMAAEPNGDNPALELGLSPGSEDSGASSPL